RWPAHLRGDLEKIKQIPVDVLNNTVTTGSGSGFPQTVHTGSTIGSIAMTGTSGPLPALTGSLWYPALTNPMSVPRRSLGSLIIPLDDKGQPNAYGKFVRPGAST